MRNIPTRTKRNVGLRITQTREPQAIPMERIMVRRCPQKEETKPDKRRAKPVPAERKKKEEAPPIWFTPNSASTSKRSGEKMVFTTIRKRMTED